MVEFYANNKDVLLRFGYINMKTLRQIDNSTLPHIPDAFYFIREYKYHFGIEIFKFDKVDEYIKYKYIRGRNLHILHDHGYPKL